jgi:glycosyltransferase involved in cell wall biosynthesis
MTAEAKSGDRIRTLYIISCPKEQFKNYYHKNGTKSLNILSRDSENLEGISSDNVITYGDTRISPFDLPLIKRLREQNYDKVVFFYNNAFRKGYLGIELFTLLLKAKKREGIYQDHGKQAINGPVFFVHAFIDIFYAFVDILGCFLLALVFIPFSLVVNIVKRNKNNKERKILFLGMGGKYSASYRVRCENFAKEMKRRGYQAEAVSFYGLHDKFIRDNTSMFVRLWDLKRCIIIVLMYLRIVFRYRDSSILYCQKVDYPALAAYIACIGSGKKLVIDYDDWDKTTFGEFFYRLNKVPVLRFEFLTRLLINKSSLCVVASEYLKKIFESWKIKKLYFVPTGVDGSVFLRKNKDASNKVITISWMGTIYKINAEWLYYFLNIYKEVKKEVNDKEIALEIAGEGTFEGYVNEYVRKNNIDDVRFLGWMPHEQIPEYLNRIDIGVFPMEKDREYERSKSPTKLFEYMACGIPCVASKIGELANVIEDGKNGYLASNKEEFKGKLLNLINDRQLRKKMGEEAAKTVRGKYSLEKCGEMLEKALKEVSH